MISGYIEHGQPIVYENPPDAIPSNGSNNARPALWNIWPGIQRVNVMNLYTDGIGLGMSGAPVFDDGLCAIVGMQHAMASETKSFVIPIDHVLSRFSNAKILEAPSTSIETFAREFNEAYQAFGLLEEPTRHIEAFTLLEINLLRIVSTYIKELFRQRITSEGIDVNLDIDPEFAFFLAASKGYLLSRFRYEGSLRCLPLADSLPSFDKLSRIFSEQYLSGLKALKDWNDNFTTRCIEYLSERGIRENFGQLPVQRLDLQCLTECWNLSMLFGAILNDFLRFGWMIHIYQC